MSLGGADEIYVLGGIQAVAALALGTDSMSRGFLVDRANAYVAKPNVSYSPVGNDLLAARRDPRHRR